MVRSRGIQNCHLHHAGREVHFPEIQRGAGNDKAPRTVADEMQRLGAVDLSFQNQLGKPEGQQVAHLPRLAGNTGNVGKKFGRGAA